MSDDTFLPPGPAGSSAIVLVDGTVLEVDHLEPRVVVDLEIEMDGSTGSSFLADVSGSDDERMVIGRLVVLNDLSSDPWLHPLAQIAAAAEFVTMVGHNAGEDLFGPALADVVGRVGDLLNEIDDDDSTLR